MINIKCVVSAPRGACSYYRSIGPYSKIKGINFEVIERGNWNTLIDCDILYMERPCLEAYVEGAKLAKIANIPLIVDYDDILGEEIPVYNQAREFYNKPETVANIEKVCRMANVITVTTEVGKEYFSKFNQNVIVIENAWNDYNFPFLRKNWSENKNIHWRGSATHRGDLMEHKDAILEVYKNKPGYRWSFFGDEHWMVSEKIDNADKLCIKEIPEILEFFFKTGQLSPGYSYVPLQDNRFNHAKSNISWLEATWAGAITFAPNWSEWQKPGVVTYNNSDELRDRMIEIIGQEKLCRKLWEQSADYIRENLLLSNINKKRVALIESLLGLKKD